MLRFRIHGHTVVPKDFSGESWMRHFANEQAAYDHIMNIDLCEVCLAPPLKCTGRLCSTFDEASHSARFCSATRQVGRRRTCDRVLLSCQACERTQAHDAENFEKGPPDQEEVRLMGELCAQSTLDGGI